MYSFILDDRSPELSRYDARTALDASLRKPLDPDELAQQERDEWGLTPDAVQAAAQKDALWGGATYGETG